MDEMGPRATIPRGGRSWGRKPARRSGRYHRSKTIQLLAGFAPRTGQGLGFPNSRKTGEDVLGFLQNTLLPRYCTHGKIYLVWDNFSAHRRPLNLWRPMPDNVEFVWTPTNASWLNLIEPWFLGPGEDRVAQPRSQNDPSHRRTPPPRNRLSQRASKTVSVAEGALNIVLFMTRTTSLLSHK